MNNSPLKTLSTLMDMGYRIVIDKSRFGYEVKAINNPDAKCDGDKTVYSGEDSFLSNAIADLAVQVVNYELYRLHLKTKIKQETT